MLRCRYVFCSMLILTVLICNGGFAEDVEELHGNKIMDNSFLLEEAYNQEPGVIQHIQTFQYLEKSENWEYSFTQEWPVPGQRHRLSYTIPVSYLNDPVKETDIGDVALNYRYQLLFQEAMAIAPRFSTLLPTGDYKEGFGSGAIGYQVNIPLSLELSGKLVNHWNMGQRLPREIKKLVEQMPIPLDTTLEPALYGLYRKTLTSCVRPYGIPLSLFR